MTPSPPAPNFERLTLFFPMWNEELTLARTVAAAHEIGGDLVASGEIGSYEILIVDDASTDTTGALADKAAHDDHRIRVVHHQRNRKLGGSVKTGLAEADGSLVLYTDADMPFDLADLAKAVRLLRVYDADIVSAYRFDRTGEGWRRAAYSFVYNLLVRSALGLSVRDVNFAFKLVRREVLDHVELHSEGSFIDAELLGRAKHLGFHIIQFGVDFFPRSRGISTLSSPSVILRIVREMTTLLPAIRALEPLPPEVRRPDRRGEGDE
ncbi:hypothetical protein BH20ACT1_BH20ACT1_12940 [soil metagenome]|nr:glycosyltransferase family 2 protein [Actinomycetota bacterium]